MINKLEQEIANRALNMSPVGVIITSSDNKIQWANQAIAEFLSKPVEQLVGLTFLEFSTRFLEGFTEHPDLWKVNDATPGRSRWLVSLESPENTTDKENIRYFVDVTEIMRLKSESRNLKDQLDNTTTADLLTGLLNYRSLMQALEPQVSRSRRYGNPLTVIVMQIDAYQAEAQNVKPVTDQVLTAVSFYLRDQMRWVDLVGRTEDNEFTLILPETNEEEAIILARKVNERIKQLSLPDSPEVTVSVDASFGIAQWSKGDDTSLLLKKAKTNLAKLGDEISVS